LLIGDFRFKINNKANIGLFCNLQFSISNQQFVGSKECSVPHPVTDDHAEPLAWLAPGTAALVALAHPTATPSQMWARLRHDPAAVLWLVRLARRLPVHRPFVADWFAHPTVTQSILRQLHDAPTGLPTWSAAQYHATIQLAHTASQLAAQVAPAWRTRAWIAGLLAPLGWLLTPTDQHERAARVGRRFARAWSLPAWLAAVVGRVHLPAAQAVPLGAVEPLYSLIQLAIGLRHEVGDHRLSLPRGAAVVPLAEQLGLKRADVQRVQVSLLTLPAEPWRNPYTEPLLRPLLRLAVAYRQTQADDHRRELEAELDHLHSILSGLPERVTDTVHAARLQGLAELAAGAGHEINNPLATIQGQAQYLLRKETVPARRQALEAIVRQTKRVHGLLLGLMTFARPTPPHAAAVELASVMSAVARELQPSATERALELLCDVPTEPAWAWADVQQLTQALTCLVRNAIDAAPPLTSVRLSLSARAETWALAIDDDGPGPTAEQRAHLFDPFYSGRSAGRGRGLGLSMAWRLAQAQGGDVRYEPRATGPTRFVLLVPQLEQSVERRSA
jgi:signal transduction histidine kinase